MAGFAVAALLLLAWFELSALDMTVQRALYDPVTGEFPWRRQPGIEYWLHIQARRALYLLPGVALIGWLANAVLVRRSTRPARRRRARRDMLRWRYLLVALLLAPTSVSIAKQLSDRPCPWDLVDFGGAERRYGLFVPAPPQARSLACFPAGHASGGFALFAFALAGGLPNLRRRRASAMAWTGSALVLGTLLGGVRVMQGAHFVSHVLWSAWLVFLVQWLLARWLLPERHATGAREHRSAIERECATAGASRC